MALHQKYHPLWFESFRLSSTSGHRDAVQLRLKRGQELPEEIIVECEERSVDPYSLVTSRNRTLSNNYPVDTKFLLKAKLNDREGRGLFFYTYHGWKPYEIVEAI